ncbi:hypothetical protein CHS0354_023103, partial [Potamilus streckersoni]
VFNHLQVVGVTTSNKTANHIMEDIGKHSYNYFVEGVRDDQSFRIIGDDTNIYVRVKHESTDHHREMIHWFGVGKEFLPCFESFYKTQPARILGIYSEVLTKKNVMVPLEVLLLKEQTYADVSILDEDSDANHLREDACVVEIESWLNDTMGKFIDEYVLGRNTDATNRIQTDTEEIMVDPL